VHRTLNCENITGTTEHGMHGKHVNEKQDVPIVVIGLLQHILHHHTKFNGSIEQKNKNGATQGIIEQHAVRGRQQTKEPKPQNIKGTARYI